MTLETQITKARFIGNGAASEWALPFPVLRPEHVFLVETAQSATAAGSPETAVAPSRYKVTGCGTPSVKVTYPLNGKPLPNGVKLTVYRLVPHVQETDLENGAAFDSEVIETTFDHIVMQIQQLREELDRTIRVTIGGDKTPEELLAELLAAAEAALKAEEAAERAEKAADLAELKSYVKNIRRTWTATADIAAGSLLSLPAPYYPGRDMLLLMHEGTVCAPLSAASQGVPQYEEMGDPKLDLPSYQVRVHFPVTAGEEFSMWVVASNAYRVSEEVAAMRDEARTEAGKAAAEAADAASSAAAARASEDAAQTAAGNAAEAATQAGDAADEAASRIAEIGRIAATAATLAPGEAATAAYDAATGVISFGIPEGQRGERGAGLQLKGVAAAPAELPDEGAEGDAYLVGDETEGFSLYVWNIAKESWENGGSLGVQLSDSVISDLSTVAASSKAVKTAYDRGTEGVNAAAVAQATANGAVMKSGGAMTGSLTIGAESGMYKCRMISNDGQYGVLHYADPNNYYIMLTNRGDAGGGFNTFRPFYVNMSNGQAVLNGNAATASALQIPRTIQTNLASASPVSFNGNANVTPGVTGVLPVANGGTGATGVQGILTNLGQIGAGGANSIHANIPIANSYSLKIQAGWGTTDANGKIYVTFPYAYSLFRVVAAIHLGPANLVISEDGAYHTLTGCALQSFWGHQNTPLGAGVNCRWFAIGM